MFCQSYLLSTVISLANPSKDSQRFVDAVVIISAPDWPVGLSNFQNVFDTPFEFGLRMSNNARLCYKLSIKRQMVVTHTFFYVMFCQSSLLSTIISFVYKGKWWFDESMSVIFCMENI